MGRTASLSRVGNLSALTNRPVVGRPTVTSISPATGVEAGGTVVSIGGTNFESGMTFTIGGNACTSVSVTGSGSATATTPAGTGTDDVVGTTSYGSGTLAGGFAYSGASSGTTVLTMDYTRGGGTGRSNDALEDVNIWDVSSGYNASAGSQIVSAATAGAPGSGNVLQSLCGATPGGFLNALVTGLGTIDSGETRNYRWTFRFDQQISGDTEQHPIQDGTGGHSTISWGFYTYYTTATTWAFKFRPNAGSNGGLSGNDHYWGSALGALTTGTWYQFEIQIHRTSSTEFKMHGRVYNAAGTVIMDDEDFVNLNGTKNLSADSPTFNLHSTLGADTLDALHWGCNGITGATIGDPYAHEGGLKIVDGLSPGSGWIGAYS